MPLHVVAVIIIIIVVTVIVIIVIIMGIHISYHRLAKPQPLQPRHSHRRAVLGAFLIQASMGKGAPNRRPRRPKVIKIASDFTGLDTASVAPGRMGGGPCEPLLQRPGLELQSCRGTHSLAK